jgi:hypothetical protein
MDKIAVSGRPNFPLMSVAEVCRKAAISEINETVLATGRYATFEIQELGISHAIRNGLASFCRKNFDASPRICQEYGVSQVVNVEGITVAANSIYGRVDHPIDVAVLYPIEEVCDYNGPNGYAWAPQNCAAIGLIEVKIQSGAEVIRNDLRFLSEVSSRPTVIGMRPLQWVMFVLVVHGTKIQVQNTLAPADSLNPLLSSSPERIQNGAGSERVAECWFDVRCYGKNILSV